MVLTLIPKFRSFTSKLEEWDRCTIGFFFSCLGKLFKKFYNVMESTSVVFKILVSWTKLFTLFVGFGYKWSEKGSLDYFLYSALQSEYAHWEDDSILMSFLQNWYVIVLPPPQNVNLLCPPSSKTKHYMTFTKFRVNKNQNIKCFIFYCL